MLKLHNLTILGTSHIAIESVNAIRKQVETEKPEIICIELDKSRLIGLLSKDKRKPGIKDIWKIGLKGYLFLLIGSYAEKKLGESVGLEPGSEMLEGIKLAQENNLKVALIDQDISITLKNFSKNLTIREIFRLIIDAFKGLFFGERELNKLGLKGADLTKVPKQEIIDKMILQVKSRYPNIYKVLIEDRNKFMAKKISTLIQNYPSSKILAIMGAGHEKEILELIQENMREK